MKLPRLQAIFETPNWPLIILYAAVFTILGAALFWQLGSLLPGYSIGEQATYFHSQSLRELLDNPLNAPFLLVVKALSYLFHDNLVATRLAAAGCGVLVLGSFAVLVRRWHGMWTAIIGTMMFGLSAWFLHVSRLGTPEVLLFGIILLTACGFWLRKTNSWLALICCFILVACLLYTPGMIWFVGLGLLWQWKTVKNVLTKHPAIVGVGSLLLLAALVPFGLALYNHHDLIRPFLALPAEWPSVMAMIENIIRIPFHLLVRNETNPTMWLGTAPILDVFSLTMFVLGSYLYLRKIRLLRTPLFLAIMILTVALMAIGSPISFTVIIPFVYLIIAAGVSRLLDWWLAVFPRNPIAKGVGWTALVLVVILACSFQVTHYFIGFPHATATSDVFTIHSKR